jgi:hypothetical protein
MFIAIAALAVSVPTIAQDATQAQTARVAVGRKQKISGVVVSREADKMVIRDINGSDVAVNVSSGTKIVEKKSNPFRSAKTYPVTALLRGLEVEVEGRGDNSGAMIAEKIKFTNDDFGVARSLDTRVAPVETRVTSTEGRMDTAENRLADRRRAERSAPVRPARRTGRGRQHGPWRSQSRSGDRRSGVIRRQSRQRRHPGHQRPDLAD